MTFGYTRGVISYHNQGTIVFYDRPQPGVPGATKFHGTVSNSARRVREGNGCCRLVYVSESNTKTCVLKPTPMLLLLFLTIPSCFVPALSWNRRRRPLCWNLEAPTCPRRELLKGDSHDALSRAILHWRTRSSRVAHHLHPYGDNVRYAHRRDHRRRLDYDNQRRKYHISLQVVADLIQFVEGSELC